LPRLLNVSRAALGSGHSIHLPIPHETLTAQSSASGQTTTGTISGHVIDTQGLALPGVTVNLQGVSVATSTNGDYIFSALPSGTYTPKFELSGFQNQERTVAVAPTPRAGRAGRAGQAGRKMR
jgi:hypothetical protein